MTENFRVRVRRGEFEIEVESTDRSYVDSKLKELSSPDPMPWNKQEAVVATVTSKQQSMAEFVRRVRPDSGPDCAVAVGYYLEKVAGQGAFNGSQIREGFTEVKFAHSNPADCILKARGAGRIMPGKENGTYVVTGTGEQWVEERLREATT